MVKRRSTRFILFLNLLLLCGIAAVAQDSIQHPRLYVSAGLRGTFGSYLISQPKAEYIKDSYSCFGELFVEFATNGRKDWQILHRYPWIGVGYMYGNPGSKKYMGNLQGVYPYIRFPLLRSGGYTGSLKLGGGLAWVSKPFDAETNPKNTLLGTRFNVLLNLNFQHEIKLFKSLYLDAGVGILHMSNGGMTLPNLGLNIPNINAGLRYKISDGPVEHRKIADSSGKKIDWAVYATVALKQYPWVGGNHYLINGFQFEASKRIKTSHAVGAGAVLFYNRTLRKYAMPTYLDSNTNKIQAGLFVAYEHFLGRLSIPVQVGAYVYNASKSGTVFQQYGLRYRITRRLGAEVLLKSHMGQADFIQTGIGYNF